MNERRSARNTELVERAAQVLFHRLIRYPKVGRDQRIVPTDSFDRSELTRR